MRAEQAELAVLLDGLAVFIDGIALRQRVAHAHDHAALDLPLTGARIDGLADVVRGDHFLDPSGLAVQDADLRRIAVGHMRNGIWHVRAELVGLCKVFSVELLPAERGHIAGVGGTEGLARAAAGLARDHRLARAGGIARVRRDPCVRALIDDLLARERRVGHDHLDEHRADALTDARCTGVDMQLPVVLHDQLAAPPVGKTDAHARIFHRAGKTDGLSGRAGRIVCLLHGLKRLNKPRLRADDLAVRQDAAGTDGVAEADLPRRDADDVRHFIQQRFDRKAGLRHAEAAERARRRVVGVVRCAIDLKILVGIGACGVGAGAFEHRPAERGKRARVRDDLCLDAEDLSGLITTEREVHPERMPLGMDEKRLGAGEFDLHGSARAVGGQRCVVLHGHVLFSAEAAADELVFDLDLLCSEHQRAFVQRGVRGLVGREDHHVAVPVDVRHGALRFEEGVFGPRRFKVAGEDVRRARDGSVCVAARDVLVRLNVALLLVKDQRRARRSGLDGVMHGGKHFIIDPDELFRLFQRLGILRHDKADRIAEIVRQPADGNERVLVVLDVADLVFTRNVLGGQDGDNAGQSLRLCGVDAEHPRTRVFAADGGGAAHAVEIPVIGVFAVALHLFRHVQTVDAGAELPVRLRGLRHKAELFVFRRQTHGCEDLHIARAAAVIVAQCVFDVGLGRVGVPVEQRLGTQHHARNAEAALDGAGLAVAEGVKLLFPVAQTLDREDAAARERIGAWRTGAARLAVDQDGAGAACALGAAVLDRGEVQLIAQIAQELLIFCGRDLAAVDKKFSHA